MNNILDVVMYDGKYTHCRKCDKKIKNKEVVYSYIGSFFRGIYYHYLCLECGDEIVENLKLQRNKILSKKRKDEEMEE
jgi:DNA-directed RNA polymerase subunit RPC12/RpoP